MTDPAAGRPRERAARLAVGVDMGATNCRLALVTVRGSILAHTRLPTNGADGPGPTLARIAAAIRLLAGDRPVEAVGLATPGPLDPRRGIILAPPNLPTWRQVPAAAQLADLLGLPCHLLRDTQAALLGEERCGAARGRRHSLLLTLGTGVGGAALVDGRLLAGRDGMAAEFGHMTMDPDGPPCGCGNRGCLEALVSGTALRARHGADPPALARAARAGDQAARRAFAEMGASLGTALAGLVNAFNPEIIILGGGVMNLADLFWKDMLDTLAARSLRHLAAGLEVRPAALGEAAGPLGAALHALRAARP